MKHVDLPKPLKTEMSPKDAKRFRDRLWNVEQEIRRYRAFYDKENRLRTRTSTNEDKNEARLGRMAETGKKIGELCCKREAIKTILEDSHA